MATAFSTMKNLCACSHQTKVLKDILLMRSEPCMWKVKCSAHVLSVTNMLLGQSEPKHIPARARHSMRALFTHPLLCLRIMGFKA